MKISRQTMAAIRFGYGFHPAQTPANGIEDVLTSIEAGARSKPAFVRQSKADKAADVRKAVKARRAKDRDMVKEMRRKMRRQAIREGIEALYQRALSPYGMYERLVAFWLDHFSIGFKSATHAMMLGSFEHDAIRAHVNGRFGDMLTAVIQHPAMLFYLDQMASVGPSSRIGKKRGRGLNENLAREVLELHTIGVDGPYTQTDVREFAELLTGYGVDRRELGFAFMPNRAEPGTETVLGRTYGGNPARATDAEALFDDLAVHPATADHLARKLAVHFVADDPNPELVQHISEAWRKSDGTLTYVYQALLEHPAAWRDFGTKIKQPQDLVVSTLRAMGLNRQSTKDVTRSDIVRLMRAVKAMNQPIYRPPGPQGWPEQAEAWITPQGLAGRLEFAGQAGQRLARARPDLDPRRFAETALRDALRPETAFAVGGAPDKWEGIALVIASPEFNRR